MTTTHTAQSTAGRTSLNQQKGASAGWCFGPDTPCMGWLSVKLITAMLCLVAIACSSVVASVVLIGSCDNALDSTRSTTIASIQDFFATSSEGLEKVTNDLVGFTSLAIKGRVYSYLTPYVMHVQRISYHVVVSEANESKGNMTWLYKQRSLVYDAARLLGQNGLYNAGFLVGPNYSLFCQPKDTSGPYNEHTFEMSILNGTGGTRYEVDAKGEPIMDKFTNAPLGGANVFLMGPASHGILNENEVIWSNVVDSYKFSGLSVTFNYKDPVSSQWMMYMVLLHLDDISRFLSDITRETQEKTNAVLRVYTAVATNLYANRYLTVDMDEALRAIVLRIQNSTYKLTGVSHGLASLLPLSATPADRNSSKGLYDIEATDPLIRAVADRLQQEPGRYDGKLAGVHAITVDPQPTAQEWMGRFYSTSLEEAGITPGPQRHYVQVSRLQDDMGLDWWVTTTIDAEYISGEIRRSYSASRAVMEVEKAEVEDEIQADRLVATMILIGVAVLLVFLASGAVYRVFEPLRTLQLEMGHVAEMNLSILQDPTRRTYSAMSEVRRMQKNFLTMARRLDEFRAFVPGAVLEGKQVSQVPPPRGVVAMVFTDIVESTALWELNSEGMDTALEMHNLLMRATLKQFDGYEVKTIGDSFMIAFDDVVNAVNFCLTTQLRLRNEPWPMELRLTPGWGLKVRMGCHCGEVGVEKNPLTGRTDYRGGCVNMAARLENRALHGTLCLASATIEALREKGVTMQGLDAKALPAGVHDLKGLGEHALYNVVPIALAERLGGSQHTATVVGFVSEKKSSVPESTSASGKDANDGYRMKGSQKTGLFLSSGPVSVVVCKMTAVEMVFDKFNSLFRGAAEAAEQTEGVVGSVTGNCLQLNWNSSKPCRMHVTAALHFAAGLEERLSGFARLGVSSGNVMHGNVGSKSHRSHTILGKPLDAAFAMADLAQSLSTFAMVADCTPQLTMLSIPAVAHSVRLFDYWSLPDQAAIMQLLCGHLLKHTWDQTLESGPVYRHNKLCPAAMAGDATALDELVVRATAAPEDIVLNALVNNLSVRNRHRDPNSGNLVVTFSLIPPGAMPDFSTPNAMTAVVAQ